MSMTVCRRYSDGNTGNGDRNEDSGKCGVNHTKDEWFVVECMCMYYEQVWIIDTKCLCENVKATLFRCDSSIVWTSVCVLMCVCVCGKKIEVENREKNHNVYKATAARQTEKHVINSIYTAHSRCYHRIFYFFTISLDFDDSILINIVRNN